MDWLGAGTRGGDFFAPQVCALPSTTGGWPLRIRVHVFAILFSFLIVFWKSVPSSSIVKTPPLPDGRGRGVADNHLIFNAVVFVEHHAFTLLVYRRF